MAHVFPADLPSFLLLVKTLRELIAIWTKADDDVALDGTHTADFWSTSGRRHRADGNLEVGRGRRSAVVGQLW